MRNNLFIFGLYLQIIQDAVFGSGYFIIKLGTFYNTGDNTWDGGDCEGWGGTCDNMFEICVKQYPPLPLGFGSCLYYKKATNQVERTAVYFQSDSTGIPRSIRINVNKYTGAGFFMRVRDYDSISSSDHVDDHAFGEAFTPGSNGNALGYSRKTYGRRSSSKSTLTFTVSVSCDQYYYSSTCERYCKPNDDVNGHYSCSSHGLRVCLSNWFVLPDCLVYCAPQNDNINGHYTCDNKGNHVCRTNWYNLPKCNTFCEPKNDDVNGHFICSSSGSRVCRSGWYTEPTCLTYCMEQDDDVNGHYTCAKNGSRICRPGYHNAPTCLTYCVPHNDDINGHYTCTNNGSRVCRQGWFFEPQCNRFCEPKDDINGRYTCDSKGYHACRKNWHSLPNCTTFCEQKIPSNYNETNYNNCTRNSNCTTKCIGTLNCTENCRNSSCTLGTDITQNDTRTISKDNKFFNHTQCRNFCKPRNGEYGHFSCSSNGSRVCRPNWYNLPNCTTFCAEKEDSNGHFGCTSNGTRICTKHWYTFPNCTTFCIAQNDSLHGHYSCKKDGSRICHKNWYNLPNCTMFCKPRSDLSGHYTCASNGSHICENHWYGAPNCTRFCKPLSDINGHYTCDANGSRICRANWYNLPNCTNYCMPNDDDKEGHYTCDVKGNTICNSGWYDANDKVCSKYCIPTRNDTLGHYNCSSDGEKICIENWYGSSCQKYCKINNVNSSNFVCNSTGDVVCMHNYYGHDCKVFCVSQVINNSRFGCDSSTGKRICSFGWTGIFCNISLDSIIQSSTSDVFATRFIGSSMSKALTVINSLTSVSSPRSSLNSARSFSTNSLLTKANKTSVHLPLPSSISSKGPSQTIMPSMTYVRESAALQSYSATEKPSFRLIESQFGNSYSRKIKSTHSSYHLFSKSNIPNRSEIFTSPASQRSWTDHLASNVKATKSSNVASVLKTSSETKLHGCISCTVIHASSSNSQRKYYLTPSTQLKISTLHTITASPNALQPSSINNRVLQTSKRATSNTVTIVAPKSTEVPIFSAPTVTPTVTPTESNKNENSDVLEWLTKTDEGKTVLAGSAIAFLLIILLIAAIVSYLRPVKPSQSKIIPFSNLETVGKRDSDTSFRGNTRFHSNKLYDLHIEKATMRGSNPWNFDNHGSGDEDIVAPSTPSVTYDRLVSRTDKVQRKVTIIPVKGNSITAYENPSRRLLFEESCI